MAKEINILFYIETSGSGGAENVMLKTISCLDRRRYNPIVVLHESRWLHEQLTMLDIDVCIVPSRRGWDIGFLLQLIKICRKYKIGIIHSHLPGATLYGCLAGLFLGIPIIATFHNEFLIPGVVENHSKLKHFIIRKLATKVVFVAEYMKKDYINKANYNSNKLLTIYNGIDLNSNDKNQDINSYRRELGIGEHELVVGNVANLRAVKNHKGLIDAAALVCRQMPNVKFLIVGEEKKEKIKDKIERHVNELGLDGKVILLGYINDINRISRVFDVFVLSSLSEGLPLSVVEASHSSLPVVATNVGGLTEVVIDGVTGFLVEPRNPKALADKLILLLGDESLRKIMGPKGKQIISEKFSIDKMIESYQNLYKEYYSKSR